MGEGSVHYTRRRGRAGGGRRTAQPRVNDILPPGNYILKFYDENGDQINVDREIPEYLRLK